MTYQIKKLYAEKYFEKFCNDFSEEVNEDSKFTNFILGLLFKDLDPYNIDSDIITEGSEDKQIDVVFIDKNSNTLNLVQTKNTTSFKQNVVVQMGNGLDWFLESEDKIKKLTNIKLREKILEARSSENGLSWDNKMKICLYYCTFGDSKKAFVDFKEEINKILEGYSEFNVEFKLIGSEDCYELIKSQEVKEINDTLLPTNGTGKVEYDIDENIKGLIITVSTQQIAELVQKYGNTLFEQNIRFALGNNKVNKKIYNTSVGDESDLFWYYNNGITIICDKCTQINNPNQISFKLENLQIVNGCQTSTTLHKAYLDNQLKDSHVLVKVFSTNDKKFVNKITEATNSQTTINSRDLVANDELQISICDALKLDGYEYEHKRNQYKGKKMVEGKRIYNEKMGQAILSIILKKPSKARGSKDSIFTEEYYKNVFDRRIYQSLLAYKIFSYCEKKRKGNKLTESYTSQIITYGTFHLARTIGEILFEDGSLPTDDIESKKIIESIETTNFLEKYFSESVNVVEKVIKQVEENIGEKTVSFTNIFKTTMIEETLNKFLKDYKNSPK